METQEKRNYLNLITQKLDQIIENTNETNQILLLLFENDEDEENEYENEYKNEDTQRYSNKEMTNEELEKQEKELNELYEEIKDIEPKTTIKKETTENEKRIRPKPE